MVRKLITTKCELLVSPNEQINIVPGTVFLEFVIGENVDCTTNAQITTNPELFRYNLDDDGLYMYYRLLIYTKSYLGENYGEKFYYDEEKDALMLGDKEIKTSAQLEKIVDDIETEYSILEIVEEPIFSICRLNYCLSEYQRNFVLGVCSGGTINCKERSSDEFARNFLFSTVFILRQLIKQQRYEEALRILKSIDGCGGLCKDTKSANKKCNCCK